MVMIMYLLTYITFRFFVSQLVFISMPLRKFHFSYNLIICYNTERYVTF